MCPKSVHANVVGLFQRNLPRAKTNCQDENVERNAGTRRARYTIESPASKKKFFSLAKSWRQVSTMSPAGKCVAMTGHFCSLDKHSRSESNHVRHHTPLPLGCHATIPQPLA